MGIELTAGLVSRDLPPITETFPRNPKYDWIEELTYERMFDSFGLETFAHRAIGSYQGDYFYIFHDPETDLYGFVTVGYGSCSGCDALLAAEGDYEQLAELRQAIFDTILWGTARQVVDYLEAKDEENDWRYYDGEYRAAIRDLAAELAIFCGQG